MMAKATDWAGPLQGAAPEAITAYFDAIHEDMVALRE